MRLPGTLRELKKQLEAFPTPVQRVQIPTKDGPLILEFAVAPPQPARPVAPPKEADPPPSDKPKKVRDTDLLHRPVPPMTYGDA